MPEKTFTVDLTEFEAAINRAYKMGEIRKRDITDIFRKADRTLVSAAKAGAGRSQKGMISKKYPSRSHPSGFLRRNIKFKTSKKYKMVWYVNSGAFYSMAYIKGHHAWQGNPFMERAIRQTESSVTNDIRAGLKTLIERTWKNG